MEDLSEPSGAVSVGEIWLRVPGHNCQLHACLCVCLSYVRVKGRRFGVVVDSVESREETRSRVKREVKCRKEGEKEAEFVMATVTTTLSSKILFSSKAPRAAFTKDRLVSFAYCLSSRSRSGSVAGLSLQPDVLRRTSPRVVVSGCVPSRAPGVGVAMASGEAGSSAPRVQKSEEEWRAVLNPEQFRILRQKGTEWAGTGKYNKFKEEGVYECAGCGTPLYKSTTKFDSGCGWPAFFEGLPDAITQTVDADGRRIEITCTACGGHLGHVFKGEGFPTPTNERHCVNSVSLKFTPANN